MKRKKEFIRKFFPIAYYEIGAIEQYLEEMAQTGLFFQKRKGGFWYFKEGTPTKLKYYIDVFDGASWFDSRPEEETLDYKEFCEENGWTYIFTEGKYQYFYAKEDQVIPIETNQAEKFKKINGTMLYTRVLISIFGVMIFLLNLFVAGIRYEHNIFYALAELSYLELSTYVIWLGLAITGCVSLIGYMIFYIKNRIRIKNGFEIRMLTLKMVKRKFKIRFLFLLIFILLYLACIAIQYPYLAFIEVGFLFFIVLLSLFATGFIKDKRESRSRVYNQMKVGVISLISVFWLLFFMGIVLVVFVQPNFFQTMGKMKYVNKNGNETFYTYNTDHLPFTLKDLGYKLKKDEYQDTYIDKEITLFSRRTEYEDMFYSLKTGDVVVGIRYQKYEFKNQFLRKKWVQAYVKNIEKVDKNMPQIAQKWGASAAYPIESKQEIILVYDKTCYKISDNLKDVVEIKAILN